MITAIYARKSTDQNLPDRGGQSDADPPDDQENEVEETHLQAEGA